MIDGECKLSAFEKGPEAAVLVLHATEQLNWVDEAVSMMTTSSSRPVLFKISHELPRTAKDVQCATPLHATWLKIGKFV